MNVINRQPIRVMLTLLLVAALAPAVCRGEEADELYDLALQKAQWFDWEDSIPLLDRVIELRPDFADAWRQRGLAKQNVKQDESAIPDFTQAIVLDAKNPESFYARGVSLSNLGNLSKAIEDFGAAIQLNAENAHYYFARGEAQVTLGENARAISDLTESIRLAPDNARAYRARGLAYAADGQNDKAIDDYRKVVELEPTEAQDWHNLGIVYLRAEKLDDAIAALTNAVDINPLRDNSFYSRANAQLEKGDRDAALSDFSKVIELNPQKADAWGRRGLILLEQGQDDDAKSDLDRCFQLAPSSRSAYLAAADEIRGTRKLAPSTQNADGASDAGPQTLEQAVRQYEAAARDGNVERIGQLFYEPMSTPYLDLFKVLTDVGVAKRRLAQAMNVRFGRAAINLPLVDDAQIRQQMMRLKRIEIAQKVKDDQGYALGMEITESRSSGSGTMRKNETFLARQQDGVWKIGPYRGDQDVLMTRRTADVMREIPPLLDRITADVEKGKYVSRFDAEQAALVAISPIMATLKVPAAQSDTPE